MRTANNLASCYCRLQRWTCAYAFEEGHRATPHIEHRCMDSAAGINAGLPWHTVCGRNAHPVLAPVQVCRGRCRGVIGGNVEDEQIHHTPVVPTRDGERRGVRRVNAVECGDTEG